jgi:hypothetical protein
MRYFTYIAEQSFKTGPNGERLFFLSGPRSRPYVVPDAATEQRIYWKLVWLLRIMLGGLILGQPVIFLVWPGLVQNPVWFVSYLVGLTAAFWVAGRMLLAADLRPLARMANPLPPSSFYRQVADKHSTRALTLGIAGCLLFVVLGAVMLAVGESVVPSIVCIVFFGLCAIVWGYALTLKRRQAA